MECPHCGKEINIGSLLGSVTSRVKAEAARENGKLGGRPRTKKRKKRSADPNVSAYSVVSEVSEVIRRTEQGR